MYQAGVRHRTTETSFTVRHLEACESYTFDVSIVGPLGYGMGSDKKISLVTDFDHHSPPKNVAVRLSPLNATDLLISWSPPCAVLTTDLGYLVTIRDTALKRTSHASLSPSRSTTLELHQAVHYGAVYEVLVEIDQPGARAFGPVSISGPAIPPPHQLSVGREVNGSYMLYWRDQDLPPEVASHNYSYIIWLSKDETFQVLNHHTHK